MLCSYQGTQRTPVQRAEGLVCLLRAILARVPGPVCLCHWLAVAKPHALLQVVCKKQGHCVLVPMVQCPGMLVAHEAMALLVCAVSVDYLTKPLEVFREVHRVLKPGGLAIMSFSNRCFPTKGGWEAFVGTVCASPCQACTLDCWLSGTR